MSVERQPALAMIVAASDNNLIGKAGELPWHLSADLKRFKRLTMGHTLIMGRKTHDSIGRLLPGRTTVILTRQQNLIVPGAYVVHCIEDALAACPQDTTPFLVGGSEVYQLGLPWVHDLYLTRVHTTLTGDAWLPELDWSQWQLIDQESYPPDERNDHAYTFEHYQRVAAADSGSDAGMPHA